MKNRKRKSKQHNAVGGVVNGGRGDTTKQGRKQKAKQDVAEMAKLARKKLTLPTGKEVLSVQKTRV